MASSALQVCKRLNMRLLHTSDLKFREFFDEVPKYAILSHRWGPLDDEVSYEDFLAGNKRHRPGWQKIEAFRSCAKEQGYSWCWVDTCCINKNSSAELSEAINSMYAWYARSSVCLAYLADVHETGDDFTESEWFSRGWTLQELIAPRRLSLLTRHWELIGDKSEDPIAKKTSHRTGIPIQVLQDPGIIQDISVARKMSWASQRKTTKLEDMSYCLLGLFEVNMPMLYGEGSKAFLRLQREIIEQYDDESIFAWREQSREVAHLAFRGIFAKSPSQFADCGNIVQLKAADDDPNSAVRITRRSVEFWASLMSIRIQGMGSNDRIYLRQLRCAHAPRPDSYLDLLVTERVLRRGLVQPCFLALSRRAEGDAFSRVITRSNPWQIGDISDWRTLDGIERQSVCVRTSFSVDAVFDRAFHGTDQESVAGGSIVDEDHLQEVHRPAVHHSESNVPPPPTTHLLTPLTASARARYRGRSDESPIAKSGPYIHVVSSRRVSQNDAEGDRRYDNDGTYRRASANDRERTRSYGDENYRRASANDRIRGRSDNYTESSRRTSENSSRNQFDGRDQHTRRPNIISDGDKRYNLDGKPAEPTYPYYYQPDAPFTSEWPNQGPQPNKTRIRRDNRNVSNPESLAQWQAMWRSLQATYPPGRSASFNAGRPPQTACGYPCSGFACVSEKGRRYAQQLRLSGQSWHDYADKLLRSGWREADFSDGPPSSD